MSSAPIDPYGESYYDEEDEDEADSIYDVMESALDAGVTVATGAQNTIATVFTGAQDTLGSIVTGGQAAVVAVAGEAAGVVEHGQDTVGAALNPLNLLGLGAGGVIGTSALVVGGALAADWLLAGGSFTRSAAAAVGLGKRRR